MTRGSSCTRSKLKGIRGLLQVVCFAYGLSCHSQDQQPELKGKGQSQPSIHAAMAALFVVYLLFVVFWFVCCLVFVLFFLGQFEYRA